MICLMCGSSDLIVRQAGRPAFLTFLRARLPCAPCRLQENSEDTVCFLHRRGKKSTCSGHSYAEEDTIKDAARTTNETLLKDFHPTDSALSNSRLAMQLGS